MTTPAENPENERKTVSPRELRAKLAKYAQALSPEETDQLEKTIVAMQQPTPAVQQPPLTRGQKMKYAGILGTALVLITGLAALNNANGPLPDEQNNAIVAEENPREKKAKIAPKLDAQEEELMLAMQALEKSHFLASLDTYFHATNAAAKEKNLTLAEMPGFAEEFLEISPRSVAPIDAKAHTQVSALTALAAVIIKKAKTQTPGADKEFTYGEQNADWEARGPAGKEKRIAELDVADATYDKALVYFAARAREAGLKNVRGQRPAEAVR